MYKGKSFLVSVSKQRSQARKKIANIVYETSPDNRCSSQHRMMEFRLRFASLLIVFIYFVFSCTSSNLVQGLPVKVNSRSARNQQSRSVQNSNDLDEVFPDPTITQKGQLYSRTGYFLVILPNGTIQTTLNNSSIYTKLERQTYNKTLKRFKGVQSKLFLAYEIRGKRKGKFVGVSQQNLDTNSLFIEHMEENSYYTYKPLDFPVHPNNTGYLAIKDNGKFRRIERSKPGMHASQFTFLTSHT